KGSFDNGTLNVLADMFVWTLENRDRINSKSYYRLMHKRKPQHLDNETVARYVVRRFFDLYSSLNFSKEVPVKERHEQIYLVYTGTNIRKRLFHIHRESDMLLNAAVRMARKGMFELEHGLVRKHGFAYTEGYKTAYRFFVLHPEQIDSHAFKIWDLKRGGTGSLTSYMFGEKAKVIREFVEYRWRRIEETYPEALEFIGKLPREDQEYAYLAMAVSPEGTSSILRCLAKYRENGGVITPGMFRTVWDMYAWAHDHWRRVNGRRYRQLTGRRKTRRVDREGLGIYVFKRYLQLYEKVEGKTETSRQNAVYQRFTGTKLRTQIFRDFEYPEPVELPFRHNYKPEALGRRIRRPYPTVYYTPLIPKFDYSDKDTLRVIKMQGSAVVQNPPNPKYPVVGFDIDTLRFKWYPVLRSATGYEVRAFDTVAVDPRFLGYYIYVDAGDPKIDGFYRCVDTGTAIKSSLSNRLYVTGREIFDIDFYAGIGSPDIWRPLQMRFNIAKRKGRLKIYLFPPDYFK
ncbi:hypothetical protein J7K41_00005, partial [Candidatus Micrarchaeota archaeon]|nr:hypothetical protein [Candidatus Micrarchaeota archaeon]